jgi:polyvinyl alcohol dehydrogenase (cytochrome)
MFDCRRLVCEGDDVKPFSKVLGLGLIALFVAAPMLIVAGFFVGAQHSLASARDKAAPLQQAPAANEEPVANKEGEALFQQRCAMCHEGGVPKAPNRAALKQMSPENVRFALLKGSMAMQGIGLTPEQIAAIAQYLTGKLPGKEQLPAEALCSAGASAAAAAFADPMGKPHWNGWGGTPEQQRFQPADMAQLSTTQVPKLKLKWAFGF